ncbi:MAG: hypothetical protein ACLFRP_08250 [Puniceicoccaceae bacterium]
MATPEPELFLESVAEAIDGVSRDDLALEMALSDIPNWDSLARLGALTIIEERFGTVISLAELSRCETLEDLRKQV